nr:MAG: hypothetical protein [Molluscum contagiosum virus]
MHLLFQHDFFFDEILSLSFFSACADSVPSSGTV